MTTLRETVEQALEALELGYDAAKSEADQYHAAMAGFRPERHAQMDAEIQQIAAAITALRAALAQQAEPVEPVAHLVALELERLAQDPPISGNTLAQARVLMTAANVREFGLDGGAPPQQTAPDHETRAELAEQQANPPGCDHCNHPLYAATKCRVCGRVTEQAEPAQEPVAVVRWNDIGHISWRTLVMLPDGTPLYAAPPKAEPLTDDEIRDLWSWSMTAEAERTGTTQQHAFARAIERAHGIGDNT